VTFIPNYSLGLAYGAFAGESEPPARYEGSSRNTSGWIGRAIWSFWCKSLVPSWQQAE